MKVLEIFQSINGEGLSSGQLTTFVRFAGCNMCCAYCDTAYSQSLDNPDIMEMTPDEIAGQCTTDYVTLTGGEPLLQDKDELHFLLNCLYHNGKKVEIETNGSIDIQPFVGASINMDFKFTDEPGYAKQAVENMVFLGIGDCVKFVVNGAEDMYRVADILYAHPDRDWTPLISAVWHNKQEEHQQCMQEIVDFMKFHKEVFHDARFQLQIHKFIWSPNRRCV